MRFAIAAWLGQDHILERGAVDLSAVSASIAGKRVALVGNARALQNGQMGGDIDAADIVIRINRAPMPSATSHGTRTDWLALATSLDPAAFADLNPKRLLWMSHKRKRLKHWMVRRSEFTLFPLGRHSALEAQIGARPTTGALLIAWLAETPLKTLDLYGFDFMASKSLSGQRDAQNVPHDFDAEQAWVRALIDGDARITLHAME